MQRVLLMAPLYRLGRKRYKNAEGLEISCMELGLMALLYFFEEMLNGKKKTGIKGLTLFLQQQTRGTLFASQKEYEKLARDIVAAFRPPTGRRNEEAFYDWEKKLPGSAQYSYLKASKADIDENEQYYVLDEQGLELIFATKEYFNEYQLSINQLILRKQLEKGQFVLALRQIEEMRLDVETLKTRMSRICQEIHRNIASEKTLSQYQKIVADLNERLKSEETTFVELKDFVKDTRQRIHDNADDDPERRAYENILDVERRLDFVHSLHRDLLQMGVELGTSALAAAEESLYFSGLDSFNFEQEITNRMFSSPLPLRASRRLIEPFLSLEQCQLWSPLAVFFPQRLENRGRESHPADILTDETLIADTKRAEKLANIQEHYARIVQHLLQFLAGRTVTTLKAFCSYIQTQDEKLWMNKQFYIFWLLLHRQQELHVTEELMGSDSVYARIPRVCPELAVIKVTEKYAILTVGAYRISDMTIEVVTHDKSK